MQSWSKPRKCLIAFETYATHRTDRHLGMCNSAIHWWFHDKAAVSRKDHWFEPVRSFRWKVLVEFFGCFGHVNGWGFPRKAGVRTAFRIRVAMYRSDSFVSFPVPTLRLLLRPIFQRSWLLFLLLLPFHNYSDHARWLTRRWSVYIRILVKGLPIYMG